MWPGVSRFLVASIEGRKAWRFVAALCLVFLTLGVLVRYSALQDLDLRFTRELQEASDPFVDRLMLGITSMGNATTLVGVAVIAAVALVSLRRRDAALFALASLVGLPADFLLKSVWDRTRPDAELVHVAVRYSGTSFPSGHAMGGTMVYGALAALAYIHLPGGWRRGTATSAFVLLAFLIDVSRVYLGAHWLSDVVGGTAVGLALLIPLVKLYAERFRRA